MQINLKEIIQAAKLLEIKLKKESSMILDIETDNYWIVGASEWSDFSKVPDPGVGSLEDDLASIKKAIDRETIISYSEVDALASLLRAISEKLAPVNYEKK
jgi:hypothetical protein